MNYRRIAEAATSKESLDDLRHASGMIEDAIFAIEKDHNPSGAIEKARLARHDLKMFLQRLADASLE